jgi:hypothetical protein
MIRSDQIRVVGLGPSFDALEKPKLLKVSVLYRILYCTEYACMYVRKLEVGWGKANRKIMLCNMDVVQVRHKIVLPGIDRRVLRTPY